MNKFIAAILTLLAFLSLISFVFIGCESTQTEQLPQIENEVIEVRNGLYEFTYKGHDYIAFRKGYGHNSWGGVVHNPDCPCHSKDTLK